MNYMQIFQKLKRPEPKIGPTFQELGFSSLYVNVVVNFNEHININDSSTSVISHCISHTSNLDCKQIKGQNQGCVVGNRQSGGRRDRYTEHLAVPQEEAACSVPHT